MSFIKSISQTPSAVNINSNDFLLGNNAGVTSNFNISTITNYLCAEYLEANSFTYARINEINTTSVSAYALLSSDINSFVIVNNGLNNTVITITPQFQSVTKIGTQVVIVQTGTGTVVVSSVDETAGVISSFNRYKLVGQNSAAALVKISNNNWLLGGDTSV